MDRLAEILPRRALPERPIPPVPEDLERLTFFCKPLRPPGAPVVARAATRENFPAAPWSERLTDLIWRSRHRDASYDLECWRSSDIVDMMQAEMSFARAFPLLHLAWTRRLAAKHFVPHRVHDVRRRVMSQRNPFTGASDPTLAGYDVEFLVAESFPAVWNAWLSRFNKTRDKPDSAPAPRLLLERYLRLENLDDGQPLAAWEAFTMRKLGGRTPYGEPLPSDDPDRSRWRPWAERWSPAPSGAPHPWLAEQNSAPFKEATALLRNVAWRDIISGGREVWPLPDSLKRLVGLP